MKAIQFYTYGGPDVLLYEDTSRPVPGSGEVLVRIYAAGINPGDWIIRSGLSQNAGLHIDFPYIPGFDISGVVEEVGAGVTEFQRGEAVYGMTQSGGAYAEYAVAPVGQLARKPSSINHVQAAGVPMSAFTAWRSLFIQAQMKAGQTVLINGAAGGVGHFAVQLAKRAGARVIGVASGRHAEFLLEMGVDQHIDYTNVSVEDVIKNVDLVVDTVGGENGYRLLKALKPGGILVPTVGGTYISRDNGRSDVFVRDVLLTAVTTAQLMKISRLIDAGDLHVIIDATFPLAQARQAHEVLGNQHARGKTILRVRE
ncbi:NADP-dependent oxidoreductase [Ktedonosporobacter rubrisoli]|uniref:NADP-dependent oxidoreductase n=2 Tax=Ktedonosporobacter rubrisoli TaxID=2509675 RepID=A0A4P6K6N4_KTERU|nr:NADP-dependent oxidoreductase [Ktedonosporobacter rubrisoli]